MEKGYVSKSVILDVFLSYFESSASEVCIPKVYGYSFPPEVPDVPVWGEGQALQKASCCAPRSRASPQVPFQQTIPTWFREPSFRDPSVLSALSDGALNHFSFPIQLAEF